MPFTASWGAFTKHQTPALSTPITTNSGFGNTTPHMFLSRPGGVKPIVPTVAEGSIGI